MKLKSIYRLAFLGSLVAFAGCAGDELDGASSGNVPESVAVTLTVSRPGDASTRTELTEDPTDGTLTSKWTTGDKLLVVTSAGVKAGELTLKEGAGKTRGVFSGDLEIADGTEATLWYLGASNGEAVPYTSATGQSQVTLTTDLSGKEDSPKLGASFDDLKRAELLKKEGVEFTVKNGVGYVKTESVLLDQMMAMAHFTLTFPDGFSVSDGATLTVNSEKGDLPNVKTWLPANSPADASYGYTFTIGDGKDIQISNNTAQLYIPIIPGKYKLTFSVTSGGKQYSCSLQEESTISEGVYYTAGAPSFAGIPIDFSKPNEYPGYENEDPRNPLHKFAKTNLTRVNGLENGFAEEGDNGALYQWGRNYGYVKNIGIYSQSWPFYTDHTIEVDYNYSHFVDAMGGYDPKEKGSSYNLDYYIHNPYPTKFIAAGTLMTPKLEGNLITDVYETPHNYSTKEDIQSHPDKYFMNADISGGTWYTFGTGVFGGETKNAKADYWLTTFGDGGSTWYDRATVCNYSRTNPCPEGWRIPTPEEFSEILPETQLVGIDNSLSQGLSSLAQVRQSKDVRYAIRWIYSQDYITIEAVVVDKDFTDSNISSLFWDESRDNGLLVSRKFPFTGAIDPLVVQFDGYYIYDTNNYEEIYAARPNHRGITRFECMEGGVQLEYGILSRYWGLIYPNDYNNGNASFGAYWTTEKKALKFEAKEKSKNVLKPNRPTFKYTSTFAVEDADPVMGYAIRPVMDK